jgi:hypothetical protein
VVLLSGVAARASTAVGSFRSFIGVSFSSLISVSPE